jgi:hypothetical protein
VEKRRFGVELFGGEGVVAEWGNTEEDVVREREWDEEEEVAC